MSFHPASNGLIPLREKTVPASPADVFFAGVERADMRYEQFEIKVDEQDGSVYINQDGGNGDRDDMVKLSLHQVPMFIAAIQKAVADVGKAD